MPSNDILRSIYLTSLFNCDNNIRRIQFYDEEVEVVFSNNMIKRYSFQVGESNVTTIENIPQKLDKIVEITEDLNESGESLKVKCEELHVFQHMYLQDFFFLFLIN